MTIRCTKFVVLSVLCIVQLVSVAKETGPVITAIFQRHIKRICVCMS